MRRSFLEGKITSIMVQVVEFILLTDTFWLFMILRGTLCIAPSALAQKGLLRERYLAVLQPNISPLKSHLPSPQSGEGLNTT